MGLTLKLKRNKNKLKIMATYKLKTSGNHTDLEEMTTEKLAKRNRQTEMVSVKLSKNVLSKMKRITGIKNPTSDTAILHAYITTTLNDYNA